MKTCICCKEHKDISEFYKHPDTADGHLGKCKSCCKEQAISNRIKNYERYRDYDKNKEITPEQKEKRAQYAKSKRGRAAHRLACLNYNSKNPHKKKATVAVRVAVASGKLTMPDKCSSCGKSGKVHGHHDDYDLPLDVVWLCPTCHNQLHKEQRKGE